jgi:septum formation protein
LTPTALSPRLVLASRSPQRRAILERLGVPFTVRPADVDELDQGDPGEVALENALRKARAAQELVGTEAGATGAEMVLGCDTLVALKGTIYGKPGDEVEARATLRALSGATHEVLSGLVLLFAGERERTAIARTAVTFRALDEKLLDWSLASGEWRGRAGGYAIQGKGSALATKVEGDYENVVGLPLAALLDIYPELLFACK